MKHLKPLFSALGALLLAACGARTGDALIVDESPFDAGAAVDAQAIDASAPPPWPAVDSGAPHADAAAPSSCGGKTCDDRLACTLDRCNEATGQCEHQHDDSSCAAGFLCTANGCEAIAYVNTETQIFEVTLPAGTERLLTPTPRLIYDIALARDGVLYGVDNGSFLSVDRTNGSINMLDIYVGLWFDALEAAPDGTFFAGGPTSVVRLVRGAHGFDQKFIVNYSSPSTSSGDLALVAGELYGTTTDDFGAAMPDDLFHIDVAHGTATKVGSIGFRCVRGLAAFGVSLFGFTCEGRVLRIDVASGGATELHRNASSYAGAAAR